VKLIASGALLIAVAPSGTKTVLDAVQAAGASVTVIGEVRPSSEGLTLVTGGIAAPLTAPARDEIARAFGLKDAD
jgi:hydrogenase maturation factor